MVFLLSARAGTQILFDDFCDREYYQVVKNIIAPRCTYDRLAEFIVPEQFDRSASLLMLLDYINETN